MSSATSPGIGRKRFKFSYPCPLDRQFLKEHDIHPAEVLNKVWEMESDREALIAWVVQRSIQRSRAAA